MSRAIENLPLAITIAIAWAGLALVVYACWPFIRDEADARRPDPAILAQLRARKRNAALAGDAANAAGEIRGRLPGAQSNNSAGLSVPPPPPPPPATADTGTLVRTPTFGRFWE